MAHLESIRAFVSVNLDEAMKTALARVVADLKKSGADVKWVKPENLHFTLKFLGEISDEQRHAVEMMLAQLARREAPFQIRLEGLGAFPSIEAPRVVWVGIAQGQEVMAHLAGEIDREGAALGLRKEARGFSPHLTLGRVRSRQRSLAGREVLTGLLRDVPRDAPPAWQATTVTLYQSVLSSEGSCYRVLAELLLIGTPHP